MILTNPWQAKCLIPQTPPDNFGPCPGYYYGTTLTTTTVLHPVLSFLRRLFRRYVQDLILLGFTPSRFREGNRLPKLSRCTVRTAIQAKPVDPWVIRSFRTLHTVLPLGLGSGSQGRQPSERAVASESDAVSISFIIPDEKVSEAPEPGLGAGGPSCLTAPLSACLGEEFLFYYTDALCASLNSPASRALNSEARFALNSPASRDL